jgi:perosamine synthetase
VFHQFTVRIPRDRDRAQQLLQEAGIGSAVHYPIPIHQQPIMREMGFGEGTFPVAEAAAEQVLSLPVHPSLGPEDVEYIASTLNRICG